jgi:tetratricopeptide (TPR) repeat protein
MDEILKEMSAARAWVIDLRATPGGNDQAGKAIADRFADTRRLYMKTYYRNGPEHDDFAPPKIWYVEPQGEARFEGPVVVLTNRWGISAAENLALAMRVLPHATQIGDFTSGVMADVYRDVLPNGWRFSVSFKLFVDATGFCWEGIGVPPDLRIVNRPEDIAAGRDRVLEFALAFAERGKPTLRDCSYSVEDLRASWATLLAQELAEGDVGEAIAGARSARAERPDGFFVDEGELLELARRLREQGRNDAAVAVLELTTFERPSSYAPWQALGRLHHDLGNTSKAQGALATAVARNRRSYPWEREDAVLANALMAGQKVLASALVEAATGAELAAVVAAYRADPGGYYVDEGDLNRLAYRLLAEGRLEDAIQVFLLNSEAFPTSANVWDSLGDGYRARGDLERATSSYERALQVNPDFRWSRENLRQLRSEGAAEEE